MKVEVSSFDAISEIDNAQSCVICSSIMMFKTFVL